MTGAPLPTGEGWHPGIASSPGFVLLNATKKFIYIPSIIIINSCYIFPVFRFPNIEKSPESLDITGFSLLPDLCVKDYFNEHFINYPRPDPFLRPLLLERHRLFLSFQISSLTSLGLHPSSRSIRPLATYLVAYLRVYP